MPYFPHSRAPMSAMAITSLALAAGSVLLLCVGPLLAIPAIILGILALRFTGGESPDKRGRGLAIAGVIVGSASLLLTVAVYAFLPALFGNLLRDLKPGDPPQFETAAPPVVATQTRPSSQAAPLPVAAVEIKTVADAVAALKSDAPERHQSAIAFLEKTPAVPAQRRQVALLLESFVAEPSLRMDALSALKTWGIKENAAGLILRLSSLKPDDIAEGNYILGALGGTQDAAVAADVLVKYLAMDVHRRSAAAALIALGPDAETAVTPCLDHRDINVAREACHILAQIGTDRSLPNLRDVSPKNAGLKREADAAIQAIQSRTPATAP